MSGRSQLGPAGGSWKCMLLGARLSLHHLRWYELAAGTAESQVGRTLDELRKTKPARLGLRLAERAEALTERSPLAKRSYR